MTTNLKRNGLLAALLSVLLALSGCVEDEQSTENMALLTGLSSDILNNLELFIVSTSPVQNQSSVATDQAIEILFSKPIHPGHCSNAFTLDDANDGEIIAGGNALVFTPTSDLTVGAHVAELTTGCEDLTGSDLLSPLSLSFNVGSTSTPKVQAVGLESQGCSTAYPGSGSATGGDHTIGTCWWDDSLAMLTPSAYEFRGGDDGTGAAASTNACADVTTDNFRIIFSEYMDTATTNSAISLTRLSSTATIRTASANWTDCQAGAPFGCRVITIAFAEAEATCNNTTNFGDVSTNGDFNLRQTNAPSIVGFPLYRLEVATTARTVEGTTLSSTFSFDVEGN